MSMPATARISGPARNNHASRDALGQKRNRNVFASAGVGVFQRLVQLASTLVLMPLLLRALGPAKFGIWGAAASLAWLSGLVDIGTGAALVTLVARSSSQERLHEARRHVAGALTLGTGLAGLMLLTAFVAAIFDGSKHHAGPYLIAAIGLALNVPISAGNSVWMALQKGYISSFWDLTQTVMTTFGLILAATMTTDVRIFIAIVYVSLILANACSLSHLFWQHAELRPQRFLFSWLAVKEVAGPGIQYFVLAVTGSLSFLLDNILAVSLLGPEASARMTIALRICVTAVGALVVLSQPLWPAFADAADKTDRKWILRTLVRGSLFLVGIAIAGSALLLIFGEKLLQVWLHTNLGIGQGLLWAIAAWVLAQALFRVPNLLLNGLSILHYQIVVFAITTSVAFALKFALAPYFGVAGILWGTTATVACIAVPACIWRIRQWARTSPHASRVFDQKIE